MLEHVQPLNDPSFPPISRGYDTVFSPVPTMTRPLERVQLAPELESEALWLRDMPFNVPSFGDAGQTYDPFVYLGILAGRTRCIALGVASIILPPRKRRLMTKCWSARFI